LKNHITSRCNGFTRRSGAHQPNTDCERVDYGWFMGRAPRLRPVLCLDDWPRKRQIVWRLRGFVVNAGATAFATVFGQNRRPAIAGMTLNLLCE